MIKSICDMLTKEIIKNVDGFDKNKYDEINYGLQLLIGEIPKFFITFFIAVLFHILDLTIISFIIILPYRMFSGGFHLHTHLGCIIATNLIYIGTAWISTILDFSNNVKYLLIIITAIFSFIMLKKYAPADTENVPILQKKERKKRKICAYVIVSIELVIAIFIPYKVISNMIIVGILTQTACITKLAYKITKNKYGYEVYG